MRGRAKYLAYKEAARALVHAKLAQFNAHYNFTLKKIFIKNHKSRWGSCSSRGNLNFNYKIVGLPPELQDYLVVHELCHLGAFNHSPEFWALVQQTTPSYKALRKRLKEVH
ncbi:MAG: hypothetical protein G01um101456_45 [Parcubacteria group bacterium Gr01-1014_56]|nr:MAG: hypothetical protein G01um101456_45 [Parcubacteria group bacterium Gr01-1014_56]